MAVARINKKQKKTISELEKIARTLGLRVSAGDLRFAGIKLKSGHCLFKGEKWVVVDHRLTFDEQVEVLSEAIGQFDWRHLEMSPDLEKIIKKNLGEPVFEPAGTDRETTP